MTQPLFVDADADTTGVTWSVGSVHEANYLLRSAHYLGPVRSARLVVVGYARGVVVATQVWRWPTARRLPADWLELTRWCLTPAAGPCAGSRQHRRAVRFIRELFPTVTTLISYSDPARGHSGTLYRACNWRWAPNWMRLRPPPSNGGTWDGVTFQHVKDRWYFPLKADHRRVKCLSVNDDAAQRAWEAEHGPLERIK